MLELYIGTILILGIVWLAVLLPSFRKTLAIVVALIIAPVAGVYMCSMLSTESERYRQSIREEHLKQERDLADAQKRCHSEQSAGWTYEYWQDPRYDSPSKPSKWPSKWPPCSTMNRDYVAGWTDIPKRTKEMYYTGNIYVDHIMNQMIDDEKLGSLCGLINALAHKPAMTPDEILQCKLGMFDSGINVQISNKDISDQDETDSKHYLVECHMVSIIDYDFGRQIVKTGVRKAWPWKYMPCWDSDDMTKKFYDEIYTNVPANVEDPTVPDPNEIARHHDDPNAQPRSLKEIREIVNKNERDYADSPNLMDKWAAGLTEKEFVIACESVAHALYQDQDCRLYNKLKEFHNISQDCLDDIRVGAGHLRSCSPQEYETYINEARATH